MKILIADDHEVVREGLRQIVKKQNPSTDIEEASTGDETLNKIENNRYDLVIMDISMPGKTGLDILQILKDRNEMIPVLVLSIHAEEQYAVRVLKLGASGYLCKSSLYKELAVAINTIIAGGRYITTSLAEKILFDRKDGLSLLPHEKLSPREFQVMSMLARGKSVNEIADDLFISNKTVSTHRTRILSKMGMEKNAELTNYAIKNNLIE
ncbi:MAG: response regulator transcription factor [Bacteroidales bacterium]|nr:response regulator transcription factor [Bacteroidales bacterium]